MEDIKNNIKETENNNILKNEIIETKKTIISATGQDYMDNMILNFSEFNTLCIVDYREDLYNECEKYNPDIVVVTDFIGGKKSLFSVLLELKSNFKNLRIIYFCGKVDYSDTIRVNNLNSLISVGINDIVQESSLNDDLVKFRLKMPMKREQNESIISKSTISIYGNKKIGQIEFIKTKNLDDINSNIFPQLFTFMSPKNGTGTTLLISNIAVAIANMGISNINGNKPKIALIDLDLEGFNLSNNFDTLDNDKNIMKAIEQTKKIITDDSLIDNKGLQMKVVDSIKKMFIPTKKYSNIKILCGPNKKYEEGDLSNITHDDIVFILETIADDYDVILVDAKSDAEYECIFPLFSMSKDIYSIIEMSFNCFNNNNRLSEYTKQFLSSQKIKFILNKELLSDEIVLNADDFKDYLEYNFVARIPYIDPIRLFNCDYEKDFIINKSDKALLKTRFEIIKASNNIWPIKNYDKLANKMDKIYEKENEDNILIEEDTYFDKIIKKIGFEKEEKDEINDTVKENDIINKLKKIKIKEKFKNISNGIKEISKDHEVNIHKNNKENNKEDNKEDESEVMEE